MEIIFELNGKPMESAEQKKWRQFFEANLKEYFKSKKHDPEKGLYHFPKLEAHYWQICVETWPKVKKTPSEFILKSMFGDLPNFYELIKDLEKSEIK